MEDDAKNHQWKTITVEADAYNTLLTRKYELRKPYQPANPKMIIAFIPGQIKTIFITKGKKVKKGDKLLILEAMKMFNQIEAPMNGTIKTIHISVGEKVSKNQILIELS